VFDRHTERERKREEVMQPRYPYQKRPREKNPTIKAIAPYTPDISTERDAMLCVPILTAKKGKRLGNMQVWRGNAGAQEDG
jgi:hypothetical protein